MSRRIVWVAVLITAWAAWSTAGAQAQVRYIHTDALGSVVAVTNEQRVVIERREYEPYGRQLTPALADGPGYTGHVQDAATGLTYMQQRYHDSEVGRFLSMDPVTAIDNQFYGFNGYRYARNNPYRFTDPDGRIDWEMLRDSIRIEGSAGPTLEAKFKFGGLKGYLGLGSVTPFGGRLTGAPDFSGFAEVTGYSGGIEVGSYGFGRRGSVERSYWLRNGSLYSKEGSTGAWMVGRKRADLILEDEGSTEISVTVGPFIGKLTGSIDIGQAWRAIRSSGKNSSEANGNQQFQGVFRVEGRIDSKRLKSK